MCIRDSLNLAYNQITEIKNIPESVTELKLWNNQITAIRNIPASVTKLDLWNNPCYEITEHMTLDEIKWQSNFIKDINVLLEEYVYDSMVQLIAEYSCHSMFITKITK